jgi:thiamine monophosphate kinase
MPQINVTVVRADTNQEYEVELPDNAKLDDLLPQLVQQIGLPLVGPDGNRISYQLSNKRTSQELKQNRTLSEYGAKNGDMLLLTSTFVAGALVAQASFPHYGRIT